MPSSKYHSAALARWAGLDPTERNRRTAAARAGALARVPARRKAAIAERITELQAELAGLE